MENFGGDLPGCQGGCNLGIDVFNCSELRHCMGIVMVVGLDVMQRNKEI